MSTLIQIVEMPSFQEFAAKHLNKAELDFIVNFLARNPMDGVVMKDTGGLRKIRFAAKGKGKSGGVRVIYYYHDMEMPLLLITGFAKNEAENLTKAERNEVKKMLPQLVQHYKTTLWRRNDEKPQTRERKKP